eukprot:6460178-Amphidinium_carterae.1
MSELTCGGFSTCAWASTLGDPVRVGDQCAAPWCPVAGFEFMAHSTTVALPGHSLPPRCCSDFQHSQGLLAGK